MGNASHLSSVLKLGVVDDLSELSSEEVSNEFGDDFGDAGGGSRASYSPPDRSRS